MLNKYYCCFCEFNSAVKMKIATTKYLVWVIAALFNLHFQFSCVCIVKLLSFQCPIYMQLFYQRRSFSKPFWFCPTQHFEVDGSRHKLDSESLAELLLRTPCSIGLAKLFLGFLLCIWKKYMLLPCTIWFIDITSWIKTSWKSIFLQCFNF